MGGIRQINRAIRASPLYTGLGKVGSWYAVSRLVQIGAMIYVTRKLDPEDFTVMAAIGAVQGVVGRFTSVNLYAELVRSDDLCEKQLGVAWSYEMLRNLLLAGLLIVAAPWVAQLMGRPEAAAVFQVSALGLLIASINSPRMVELRRKGKFGALGALESVAPIAYSIAAILFVSIRPDYWALVWAGLAGSGVFAMATHIVCAWVPKLDLTWRLARPLFMFGLVLQLNSVCGALRQHGLVYVLVFWGMADAMGYYNRAVAFSLALGVQATGLVWKVAYPHFSEAERSGEKSLDEAKKMQRSWIGLGLPVALLGVVGGYWAIPAILGEQWTGIRLCWGLMVLASVFLIANAPLAAAFQSSRNEYSAMILPVVTTVVQLGAGFVLVKEYGLEGAGAAVLLGTITGFFVSRLLAKRLLSTRLDDPRNAHA